MALFLKIETIGSGLLEKERIQRKIELVEGFMKDFRMERTGMWLWKGAPLPQLGEKLQGRPLSGLSESQLLEISVEYRGVFLHDGEELPFYVLINNKKLRKYYGDIEVDFSVHSLEEIYIEDKEFVARIKKFIEDTNKGKTVRIHQAVIGESPDSLFDARERVFVYYYKPYLFIKDLLRTMVLEAEESARLSKFIEYFKPYNLDYLARKIYTLPAFNKYFEKLASISQVSITPSGSIFIETRQKKGFMNLYNQFRADFQETVGNEWPDEKKLEQILLKWIRKEQRKITDF